jgi:hypothetical protein
MAALRVALLEWVVQGREPPPSRYPRLADGQLAANDAASMRWPAIPGVPGPTGMAVGLMDYDFGPQLNSNDFRGVLGHWPPLIRQTLPALMPRLDADGNEPVGVASVLHQAPLGTYTGWNVTRAGFFMGQPCGGGLTGGYVPFARTLVERTASGDPRPSLEERYGSMPGYLCVVRRAAEREVSQRFLLAVDAERLLKQAAQSTLFAGQPASPEALKAAAVRCGS